MQAMRRAVVLGIVVLFGVALSAGLGDVSAQDNPRLGTWKLNVAKSKYSSGQPPQSSTMKIDASGEGEKVMTEGVNATGAPTKIEYTAQYDGKDYAYTGSQNADKIALKRVDGRTVERTLKKGDKAVITSVQAVSADGKMLTNTVKGTDAQGQALDNVQVWDKQ
jgi:hypothetical protein